MTLNERITRLTVMLAPMVRSAGYANYSWLVRHGRWHMSLNDVVRTVATGKSGFWAFGKGAAMRWLERHAPDAYAFAREHCRTFQWFAAKPWRPRIVFDPCFGRCRRDGPWGEGGVRWL